MSKCGKCWMRYCSETCSVHHWKVHKPICKNLTSWLATHASKNKKSKKYAALLHEHITPGMGFCFLNEDQYDRCLRMMRMTSVSMMYDIRQGFRLADPANRLRGAPSGGEPPAEGPRGGGRGGGPPAEGPGGKRGSPRRLYKAPTDYLYKAPEYQTKPHKHYTNPLNITQRPKILNNTIQY